MTITKATALLLLECKSRSLSPATLKFYGQRRDCLVSAIGDMTLGDITIHHLREAITKASPRSAPHLYMFIKRLFSFLIDEDVIKANPALNLKRPKLKKLVTLPLTQEQIVKCYTVAKNYPGYTALRDAAMFALLVGTGLRREELCLLKDSDVHLTSSDTQSGVLSSMARGRSSASCL